MMFLKYIFDKIPGYSYLKTLQFEESIEDIDGFFVIASTGSGVDDTALLVIEKLITLGAKIDLYGFCR